MSFSALLVPFILLFQAGQAPAPPAISARLLAGATAIQPGGTVALAVEISLEKDWHIYHPIHLDAGAPTLLTFSIAGAQPDAEPLVHFGPVLFPTPQFGEMAGFEYLAFPDKVALLTDVSLSDQAPVGAPLKLRVQVDGIACHDKKGCIPVKIAAALDLPVTSAPGKSANEELFTKTRDALPPSFAKGKYIEGSKVEISKDKLGLGEAAEVVATIKVKVGHHLQDRNPGMEGMIPTRLFVEQMDGLGFKDQVWPEPRIHELAGIGKVRELGGEFQIRAPFAITDQKFPSGPVALHVLMYYQCCMDSGQCFPPEFAEAIVQFAAETGNPPRPAGAGVVSYIPAFTRDGGSGAPATAPADSGAATRPAAAAANASGAPAVPEQSLWLMLILGFVGGMILNVMPCVLPVISIKVLSFVQQAGEDPKRVLRLGLAFCAGIMVWFWLFAALSATQNVALQEPKVVLALGSVLFLLALNLFGVYELTLPGAAVGKLDEVTQREGYVGSFFKGFLATILGTACTAPFLVSALAYAATQPVYVGFLVFSAAGVGMASPYLLLAANPAWLRFVPRPGQWMITFKQAMGFVLLGTSVWMLYILKDQLDAAGIVWTVSFWGFLGLAVWMIGKIRPNWEVGGRLSMWAGAAAVAALGWWFSFHVMYDWKRSTANTDTSVQAVIDAVFAASWDEHIPWQPYRPGLAAELSRMGYTVYVDYTATWCLTCQANKKIALEIAETRAKMQAMRVIPIKADYTGPNPAIQKDLLAFGHNNVPMNLVYPAGRPDAPIVLPVVLTPGIVTKALDEAGPSTAAPPRSLAGTP